MEEKIIRALRAMAWERAKGELNSMLHTFYSDTTYDDDDKFEELNVAIKTFIQQVENEGLQE